MKISREDVHYVAELANLELSETEVETFRQQLDDILTYIDKLKQLDVSDVEPMAQVLHLSANSQFALRDDVVRQSDAGDAILQQAPEAAEPYFRVPKVIDR
jgi:aspartyl-tRNA(Asn)/glutamyl-tRNA(Gln) amidotransferase subunit C